MILGPTMPIPIEAMWADLERIGTFPAHQRVSAGHPLDLYAEVAESGIVGLLAVCDEEPPTPPSYESVSVEIGRRADARWAVQIKLVRPEFRSLFSRLCDDIVASGKTGQKKERAGHYVLGRLARWRLLLDLGPDGLLSDAALRGLTAEVLFLREAISVYGIALSVAGWNGPFGAAQDFDLPNRRFEIKAVTQSATTVRISSIDQLDIAMSEITLVVYVLRRVDLETPGAFTLPSLVANVRTSLGSAGSTLEEFEARLLSAGYQDSDEYQKIAFKIDDVRHYAITSAFPKLVRSELSASISFATYDLVLAKCEDYRVAPLGSLDGS